MTVVECGVWAAGGALAGIPLPLRERVAREAGRVRGRAADPAINPSSVASGDTFSRKGRRDLWEYSGLYPRNSRPRPQRNQALVDFTRP